MFDTCSVGHCGDIADRMWRYEFGHAPTSLGNKDLVVSAGLADRFGLIEKPAEYRDDEVRSKRRF